MKVLQTLTTYAQGFSQAETPDWVNFLAPEVATGAASGMFKKFDARQDFIPQATKRGIGGAANRIEFGASDGTYNCMPNALEIPIDDHERDQAGDGIFDLQAAKARTLISSARVSHAVAAITIARAGIAAADSPSDWGSSGDPVADINAQQAAIFKATGNMPNRVLMDFDAWVLFRDNAAVKARLGDNQLQVLQPNQVGGFFLNPSTEFMVSALIKDTNRGQTSSKSSVSAGEVWVFHGSSSPTLFDPAFMKTFRTKRGGVDMVHMYREDRNRSDILAVDWTEDIQVVSTISGKRITVSG